MPTQRVSLLGAMALGMALQSCSCNKPAPAIQTLLKEGERCDQDDQCQSNLCAAVPKGERVCLRTCEEGCTASELCTTFGVALSGQLRAGCVPQKPGLCQACTTSDDCPYAADACLAIGEASLCGRDCSWDGQCPDGYQCSTGVLAQGGRSAPRQCVPKSGTCSCLPGNEGLTRPCQNKNEFGTCVGKETCDPKVGFVGCDARVPAKEVCNGEDDDCNGRVDDFIPEQTCGVGECKVTIPGCIGKTAPECVPGTPKAELCNGLDDDCDGVVDNGFDLTSDPKHCGDCKTECRMAHGTPRCTAGACAVGSCQANWDDCNHSYADGCETDLLTDVAHCGGCAKPCQLANANPKCQGGKCAVASCQDGHYDLNGDPADGCEYACTVTRSGVEVCDGIDNDCNGKIDDGFDLTRDVNHCGDCNTVCPTLNGVPGCVAGICQIACLGGWADCSALIGGCETDIAGDVNNCGGCGKLCAPAMATPRCDKGQCAIASCIAGHYDINGLASDGCEYACTVTNGGVEKCDTIDNDCNGKIDETFDLMTDVNNCGACGTVCPSLNGVASCVAGKCQIACNTGFADCDAAIPGCETNTLTSLANCGGCNLGCSPAHATGTCSNGTCGVATCQAGWSNCNGLASDGCEVDNTTDVTNCGGCGKVCSVANGSANCINAVCGVAGCSAPYKDCDNLYSNGCESNTFSDKANCGACGTACPLPANSTSNCNGSCGYACNWGWADCDGITTNGCERQLNINAAAPPNCTTFGDWGSVRGDEAADTLTNSGFAEGTYKFHVYENYQDCLFCSGTNLSATLTFTAPTGVDMQLYVRHGGCGVGVGTTLSVPAGTSVSYATCGCDRSFQWDSYDVWVEVVYVNGSACANWTLTVQGNVPHNCGGCI